MVILDKQKKIAILGTRGIPNNYGGFEQLAQYLSLGLSQRGYDVTVYNPHDHEYKEPLYHSVKIVKKLDPHKILGSASQFVYDYFCLRDAIRRHFDVVIELGYGSSALSLLICSTKKIKVITNMDGMEWQRQKWNLVVQRLTRWFEKVAVNKSDILVSDSKEIQKYYLNNYSKPSTFIPYGADPVSTIDDSHLEKFQLTNRNYHLIICRLERENNIETIINGVLKSNNVSPLVIVGNHQVGYGKSIFNKFKSHNKIRFLNSIYNRDVLNCLKKYSMLYFHGHSIGGTNPSLLEAMASGCQIAAHDNPYNREVLGLDAQYFSNFNDVKNIIDNKIVLPEITQTRIQNNLDKIDKIYNWDTIIQSYEAIL